MMAITAGVGVLAFLLVGTMLLAARRAGVLDRPGARSSHLTPTPTGVGLGLVCAIAIAALLAGPGPEALWSGRGAYPRFWLAAALLALGLSVIGFLDDLRGVPAGARFALQLLAAAALLAAPGIGWGAASVVALLPAVLALTWTMNAYNFMDGSNGMAGLQGVFGGALLALLFALRSQPELSLAAATVAAACAGFLPWNLPRARGFMGDAGSVPLGFLLGALCLAGALTGALPWPVAPLALAAFHVDAGLTLLRRLWRRQRWYTPHREHVYQRLIAHGWPHTKVAVLYLAINVVIVAPAALLGTLHNEHAWWFGAGAVAVLVAGWLATSSMLGEGT